MFPANAGKVMVAIAPASAARRRGRAAPALAGGQLTLMAESSMTKDVWRLTSSVPVNFKVMVWPA